MSVYDHEAFEERVNYAASVISKGVVPINGRTFDTCFEMFDGDYIVAALVRRTVQNPDSKLAANIFKFLCKDSILTSYENTKMFSRKELREKGLQVVKEQREAMEKKYGFKYSK